MKDRTKFAYTCPSVEVLSLDKEDVICTSPLLGASFLLGEVSWDSSWLEKLSSPASMTDLNSFE